MLVWKGGSDGITYVNNIPESYVPFELGLISTLGLTATTQNLRAAAVPYVEVLNGVVRFPTNYFTAYEYNAGQNPQSSANKIYEGIYTGNTYNTPKIADGWYGYRDTNLPRNCTAPNSCTVNLYLTYIENGVIAGSRGITVAANSE